MVCVIGGKKQSLSRDNASFLKGWTVLLAEFLECGSIWNPLNTLVESCKSS